MTLGQADFIPMEKGFSTDSGSRPQAFALSCFAELPALPRLDLREMLRGMKSYPKMQILPRLFEGSRSLAG